MDIKCTKIRGKKYMLDLNGRAIKVGNTVGFNCSGTVRIGKIISIKEGKYIKWNDNFQYWAIKPKITISWTDNKTQKTKKSVVTSAHNLISLSGQYFN